MMTTIDYETLEFWFKQVEELNLKFENEKQYHPNKQLSGLIFLNFKLKDNKDDFLHGEHDMILLGSSLDSFEEFTIDDVKTLVSHGIFLDEDGFQMGASL